MKKVLNLQQLIDLQATIEKMISSVQIDIIKYNPTFKYDEENNVDVVELYKKYNNLLDQLVVIKLAKDKANRKRSGFNGLTNQQLILELSNLTRKKTLLETMFSSKLKTRKGGKQGQYTFHIPKSEIEDELTEVSERISNIKKSMTKFNNSTKVKVVIFEELKLL